MKTMKIMKRLMGCAAAILALTACSESEDLLAAYHSDSKAVHITAQVGKASADGFTRSNPLGTAEEQAKFNENDEISVKADGQDAVTYKLVGSEWQPQGGKFLKWEKETMNFTAYYPASFNGTINQPEKYNSEADLAAADFMSFSGPQTNTNKSNQLTLTMKREMARVVVEIAGFNDQYAGATIDNVNSLNICGVKAYKHTDNKFYALIKPCAAQSSETFLSLEVVEGEGESKTTTEKYTGIPELVAGNSYTYQLKVGKNKISVSGITVADWNTGTITDNGKAEEIPPYITFKADAEQKFKMTIEEEYEINGLEYSVNNDETWRKVEKDREITFGGANGDLRLRGTNPNGTATDIFNYSTIIFTDATVKVACTGDIRTLLNWKNYSTVDTKNARFCSLFVRCTALTSAPELPATTLADVCYSNMFFGCTSLTSAPKLPATKLAESCYNAMFNGCTSLTSTPELPATTLANWCYYEMFNGCTSLTSAPILPATKLADWCYSNMFNNCKSLSTVTMLAPASEINSAWQFYFFDDWLNNDAGTDASSRTLKVKDEAAYNALERNLPDIWKKGDTNTTVLYKDNGK